MKTLAVVIVAALLSGCGPVMLTNPKTGEIVQCNDNSQVFGYTGQKIANDKCAAVYERAGWLRMN